MDRAEVSARKKEIRRQVLALRDGMPEEERKRASYLLTDRLLGHQWFYRAENVLCFASFGSEIDTSELILEALRAGKKVFVPRVEGGRMSFYRILSLDGLKEGYRGIREPDGRTERFCYREEEAEKTVMIMPGTAFDPYRRRLGYGKGFYDRYLAERPGLALHTIAIGFTCQQVEELPEEETDIRPYQVILQK